MPPGPRARKDTSSGIPRRCCNKQIVIFNGVVGELCGSLDSASWLSERQGVDAMRSWRGEAKEKYE